MSTVINTNMFSIYAQTQANLTHRSEQVVMERLSSGARINYAQDDANGIAVASEIDSRISALNKGLQNANDGVSMVQLADGAVGEMTSLLHRMRENALQGASGTLSGVNYGSLQIEFAGLQSEIQSILENTTFAGESVLNRSVGASDLISFHVGSDQAGAVTQGKFTGISVVPELKSSSSVSGLDGEVVGMYEGVGLKGGAGSAVELVVGVEQYINVEVDGVSSGSIVVSPKTLTKGEWATEIESLINSDSVLSGSSKEVAVIYNDLTDKFEIKSNFSKSGASVKMLGDTSSLGLDTFFGSSTTTNIGAVPGYYQGFEMAGNAGGAENATLPANSTFTISLDGTTSGPIDLTTSSADTKTKSDWAVALQNAINGDSTLAAELKTVSVAYDGAKDAFEITSSSGGASSRVYVTTASESMATLGISPVGQEVELISLEGAPASERELIFTINGEVQPQITLPATTKTVNEWAEAIEAQVTGIQVAYDSEKKQYTFTTDSDGYGSTVSFTGSVPALGITAEGETRNGYNNINEILLNHYDLDAPDHALGDLLLNTQSIASQVDASAMLSKIDSALDFSNGVRAHYASVQNRLETVAEYMEDVKVRHSEAFSKINDTDFAAESAELAKLDILKQVTTAMMAQANQLPKQMLQLFK